MLLLTRQGGVAVMDEMIYNSLSSYYHALGVRGYMPYVDAQKLLLLIFYRDFVYGDYRGVLSKEDYYLIERALNCLFGSSCLIPYPDYLKSGKFNLGRTSELASRIAELEDTMVVKPISVGEDDTTDSDIKILEGVENLISSFTVSPLSVIDFDTSTIHFSATTTKATTLQIEKVVGDTREVIYGPLTGTQIDYNYTLVNPSAGDITFVLSATYREDISTRSRTITVQDVPITISSFTANPSLLYIGEETTVVFDGVASRRGELSILDQTEAVLCTLQNVDNIHYAHTINPSTTGNLSFTMVARCGNKQTVSQQVNIQVNRHEYYTMYYGNSDSEISDGASVKSLSTTNSNSIEGTYDRAYYYIAVHSSKELKSIINRGVEPVTDNFVLKNNALVLDVFGTQQTYKLYECDINSYADVGDMDTYILTITIE